LNSTGPEDVGFEPHHHRAQRMWGLNHIITVPRGCGVWTTSSPYWMLMYLDFLQSSAVGTFSSELHLCAFLACHFW